MMIGIFGTKIGMTRIYDEKGNVLPVTLIKTLEAKVLEVKSSNKDGYDAVKVGYGKRSKKSVNRASKGYAKKTKADDFFKVKELRFDDGASYEQGQSIDLSILESAEFVDVTGISKGKGFQGVIKRHGFGGGPGGHGSHFYRAPGSIGNCSDPARVFKGKKMPGQMGNEKKTMQNLKLVKIDKDKGVLLVKGSIPGKNNGDVLIKQSIKKLNQKVS